MTFSTKRMLEAGFFPEVLPPCFTSAELPSVYERLRQHPNPKEETRHILHYSATKSNYLRRGFGTVNPYDFFQISEFISKHFSHFEDKFHTSNLSLSKPIFDDPLRAIRIPDMRTVNRQKLECLKHSKWALITDISYYFASIYTHSFEWAAHGKTLAKEKRGRLLFSRIDRLLRASNDLESLGIPIGPDYSRILSEFIGCTIDEKLEKEVRRQNIGFIGGLRNVDDFVLGFDTYEHAQHGLSILTDVLHAYNLRINQSKTLIVETNHILSEEWTDLFAVKYEDVTAGVKQLKLFIEKAIRLSNRSNTQSPQGEL